MRRTVCLWAAIWGLLSFSLTQAQGQNGLLDTPLDRLLTRWSMQTRNVKCLYAQFNRTIEDFVWKNKDVAWGSARYLSIPQQPGQPDLALARLDILGPTPEQSQPNAADVRESFIVNGQGEIWQLEVQRKIVRIWKLPPGNQQPLAEDGPLPFLFGADPLKTKQRYALTLISDDPQTAVAHVRAQPKLPADSKEFVVADLFLNTNKMVPTRLVFQQPNGNTITYDFTGTWGVPAAGADAEKCVVWTDIQDGIQLQPVDFKTDVPPGWNKIEQQVAQQPGLPEQQPR